MEGNTNKTNQNVEDSDLIWYLEEVSNSTSPIFNTFNKNTTACEPADEVQLQLGEISFNKNTTACEPADEVQLGEVSYIKKETYLRLKRKIALLESYLNSVIEELENVKLLFEEIKNG